MHQPNGLLLAIVHLVLTGVSVFVVAKILPGIKVKSFGSALAFAVVVAVLNAIAWHVLAPLSIAFTVVTLGIGALIINGILFLLAGKVIDGVQISGCFTAALASLGVTLMNWLMHLVLGRWAP